VILDISGEWDAFIQQYGNWPGGEWEQKISITQDGSTFEGLRSMDTGRMQKGSVLVKGELYKGGLKNVYIGSGWGMLMTGTQITEGGDKIEIDAWDKVRVYLKRPKERVAALPSKPKPEVTERIKLRDKAEKNFSDADLQKMIKERNFFNKQLNPQGSFLTSFVDNGNGTVTEKATGLMWQKAGSSSEMKFYTADKYIEELNSNRFGGHSDWRLPTMEELCSLLEATPNEYGKFIDKLFDPAQSVCWSADVNPKSRPAGVAVTVQAAFGVSFVRGETLEGVADKLALSSIVQGSYYVKAVRTAQ
jgi:hypothetical protein